MSSLIYLPSFFFLRDSAKFENGSDLPESDAPYFLSASALSKLSNNLIESTIFLFDKSFSAMQDLY